MVESESGSRSLLIVGDQVFSVWAKCRGSGNGLTLCLAWEGLNEKLFSSLMVADTRFVIVGVDAELLLFWLKLDQRSYYPQGAEAPDGGKYILHRVVSFVENVQTLALPVSGGGGGLWAHSMVPAGKFAVNSWGDLRPGVNLSEVVGGDVLAELSLVERLAFETWKLSEFQDAPPEAHRSVAKVAFDAATAFSQEMYSRRADAAAQS